MTRPHTAPHAAHRRLRPTGLALAAAAALGGLLATGMAQAKTVTWTGAAPASDNWSANPNWDSGRPVTGDDLVFAGSNRLNNTLNISPLSFHSLSFSAGAGAFVINGTGALVTSAGNITNNSSNLQTLNASLIVGGSQTWAGGTAGLSFKGLSFASGAAASTVTGTGLIRSMGDITNNSGNLQTLATVLTLGAAQTWTGGTAGLAVGGLAGSSDLALGSTKLNLGASGGTGVASTYAGSITAGSGGLVYRAASGSQTLTGTASQLAFLNIAQGALTLGGGAMVVNGSGVGLDQTGGTLLINNGATVQFTSAAYNDIHGANGTMTTVSGNGTTLQTSGWLDVGVRDHGSLVVTQGAQLNAQQVFVGRDSTGHGSLTVSAGGKVSVAGALQIGEFATGSGLVTLDGAGSALETGSIELGSIYGGPGAMVISNKASASADGALTFSNAASSLTVNGGSLWVGLLNGNQGTISLTDPSGVAALTVGGDNVAGSFAGVISGPGSLTKAGSATQTLSGSGSTLGQLLVQGGQLTLSGGSLALTGPSTTPLQVLGGSLLVSDGAQLSIGGHTGSFVDGFGMQAPALTVQGSGTQVLSGLPFMVGGVRSLSSTGSLSVQDGALFSVSSLSAAGNGSTLRVDGAGSRLVVAGALELGSSSVLASSGYGTLTVSNGSSVAVGGATTLYTAGSGVVVKGGTLVTAALQGDAGSIDLTDPAGGTALTINGNAASAFAGLITGSGSVRNSGTGTLTLAGANTFSGQAIIDGGRIVLGNALALQNAQVVINVNGGLNLNGQASAGIRALSGGGALDLGATTLTLGATGAGAADSSFAGRITASTGGLNYNAASGVQTLTGSGSLVNILGITQGTLNLNGGGSMTVAGSSGTALNMTGRALLVNGGAQLQLGRMTSENGPLIVNSIGHGSGSGSSAAVTVSGPGSQLVTGFQTTFGSSSQSQGSLTVEQGGAVDADYYLLFGLSSGSTGRLSVASGGQVTASLLGAGVFAGSTGYVDVDGSGSSLAAGLLLALGGANPWQLGGTGVLTLSNGAAATAGTTALYTTTSSLKIDGATLVTGSLTGVGGTVSLTDPDGAPALTLTGADNGSFAGAISGSGSLLKTGAASQVLAGTNTFTGTVTVNGGSLEMASGAASAYQVGSGGTLKLGYGTLGWTPVQADAGGTVVYNTKTLNGGLLIGNGTHDVSTVTRYNGTTVSNGVSLALANNAKLVGVSSAGNLSVTSGRTVGVDSGLWNINGTLALTAGAEGGHFTIRVATLDQTDQAITLGDFNASHNYSWLIANASGGITGYAPGLFSVDSTAFLNPLNGGSFSVAEVGNGLVLNFTSAVPEPSSAALMGAGALLLALARRRQGRGATGLPAASQR